MKSIERHKLKENEFAHTVARTRAMVEQRRNEITTIVVAVIAVVVIAGGYLWWRSSRDNKAQALLASALVTTEAPVYTPPPPAPGSPPPVQPPGTFRTDRERLDAAVPKLQAAADAYPNSEAGITARFRLAAALGAFCPLRRSGAALQRSGPEGGLAEHLSLYGAARRRRSAARAGEERRGDRHVQGAVGRLEFTGAGGRRADAARARRHGFRQEGRGDARLHARDRRIPAEPLRDRRQSEN